RRRQHFVQSFFRPHFRRSSCIWKSRFPRKAATAARTAGERTRCGTCFYYAGPRPRRKVTFFKNAVSILQAARSGEKCNF
ncbi:hypothetical protein, partial [Ruthenibacterium lactatiformans]|uniref:hypothetical protein n=1 Tax=Ruthenibacterium lactatiformans TaxID=1550024 RepID=UPI00266CE5FA